MILYTSLASQHGCPPSPWAHCPAFNWRTAVAEHLNPSPPSPFMILLLSHPVIWRGETYKHVLERHRDMSGICQRMSALFVSNVCWVPHVWCERASLIQAHPSVCHCVKCNYQQASLQPLLQWNNYPFSKCKSPFFFFCSFAQCYYVSGGGSTYSFS